MFEIKQFPDIFKTRISHIGLVIENSGMTVWGRFCLVATTAGSWIILHEAPNFQDDVSYSYLLLSENRQAEACPYEALSITPAPKHSPLLVYTVPVKLLCH